MRTIITGIILLSLTSASAQAACNHFVERKMDSDAINAQVAEDRAEGYFHNLGAAVFFSGVPNSCKSAGYDRWWIRDQITVFECSGWLKPHELFFTNVKEQTIDGKEYVFADVTEVGAFSNSPTGICVYADYKEKPYLAIAMKAFTDSSMGSTFDRLTHWRSQQRKKIQGCYQLQDLDVTVTDSFDKECKIRQDREI